MSEEGIESFAASDAILLAVCPTIGACKDMLDAGVSRGERLFAEEAQASLEVHESGKLLHWDECLTTTFASPPSAARWESNSEPAHCKQRDDDCPSVDQWHRRALGIRRVVRLQFTQTARRPREHGQTPA